MQEKYNDYKRKVSFDASNGGSESEKCNIAFNDKKVKPVFVNILNDVHNGIMEMVYK